MRQHELLEARPVLGIQHVRAFPLVRATHGHEPPERAFYSQSPLGCDYSSKGFVSTEIGNNWRHPVVWTSETRPIRGAGSLDSLTRAALPSKLAGTGDREKLRILVCSYVEEETMTEKVKDEILHDHNHDGIDRRGFLKCMAWAGTGAFCVMQGGVLKSYSMSRLSEMNPEALKGGLSFVQISDSHMGFNKPANPDVAATLKAAVDKINSLLAAPEFILHTGDISHLSKPEEFDTVDQILKGASAKDVFFVP